MNNVIFWNLNAQPAHVINLAVDLFDDMRYYIVITRVVGQDNATGSQIKFRRIRQSELCWGSPPEAWTEVNVNVSRRQWTKSATLDNLMRDNRSNVIIVTSKRLENCPILVVECFALQKQF